ncbi:hypothetical protein [Streptomyces xanthii]|uniref:Tat pathway signal sequence domain protein n=1 Tax=Streptomyces xanthii TaxID=2768069 RepID=A0A7H1B1X6_9ACTN|nr:hypothetical protein [Streptomyces xanthii]QNS02731.1 hypothetical protein IAG42_03220 [Streptomyces xanthii]
MNVQLHLRLLAAAASTGLALTACGSSGSTSHAPASPSAPPDTPASSSSSPRSAAAPAPPGTTTGLAPQTYKPTALPEPKTRTAHASGLGRLQPLWPFTSLAQARAWERDYHSGGHQPWHLDPDLTALAFTQGYLGFQDIGRVSSHHVSGRHAHIGVGLSKPKGVTGTAATIHLVRYGTGRDAPWEVVGTDDTTFSLTLPAYGATVRSPLLTGGRITGVDESIRVQVRQPSSGAPLGTACCVAAGGKNQPWKERVSYRGATNRVLTVVATTGGHVAEVERFTVTAVHPG